MKYRKISKDARGFALIPDAACEFEGIYRGYRELPGETGSYNAYLIEAISPIALKGGETAQSGEYVFFSGAALDVLESDARPGEMVKLVFGPLITKRGGRKYRPCDVYVADAPF